MSAQISVQTGGEFPAAAIETCIRETLATAHESQLLLRPQPSSVCEPEVDSLVVIEVMCAIEQLLGVVLPTSFVPRGGYDDVNSCVSDLVFHSQEVWVALVQAKEEHHV
jgi:acyl carrier protein